MKNELTFSVRVSLFCGFVPVVEPYVNVHGIEFDVRVKRKKEKREKKQPRKIDIWTSERKVCSFFFVSLRCQNRKLMIRQNENDFTYQL